MASRSDAPVRASSAGETTAAEDRVAETLLLAEWRRAIAELYGRARAKGATDPAAAWEEWRSIRDELYRSHASSPVPASKRTGFVPLYFPYDPGLRFELPLLPAEVREPAATLAGAGLAALPISTGLALSFERVGWFDVPFASGVRRLSVFWLADYAGGFFLPFRDATNDTETYGGGRYLLDSAKGADLGGNSARGTVIVDFNFAYQPSCAFDPRWSCPLSPLENRLDLAVRAGERLS